jgi:hypothetical protein
VRGGGVWLALGGELLFLGVGLDAATFDRQRLALVRDCTVDRGPHHRHQPSIRPQAENATPAERKQPLPLQTHPQKPTNPNQPNAHQAARPNNLPAPPDEPKTQWAPGAGTRRGPSGCVKETRPQPSRSLPRSPTAVERLRVACVAVVAPVPKVPETVHDLPVVLPRTRLLSP